MSARPTSRVVAVARHARLLLAVALPALSACASSGAAGAPAGQATAGVAGRDSVKSDGRSMADAIVPHFPGVAINAAEGGGFKIRILGSQSGSASADPLILVDDVPQPTGRNGVVYLNPQDIARVEVLKNPADLTLYGMRAANGVVRITLKKAGH